MLEEHPGEVQRLAAQADAHGHLGRSAVVSLVEQEIERPLHRRQALLELGVVVEFEEPPTRCERLLRTPDALVGPIAGRS
jgi:hypothetical protein